MKSIQTVDLKKEYSFLNKTIKTNLDDCFKSQDWILGGKVSEFEQKSAKYLRTRFSLGVASGTDALLIALRALALSIKKKEYFDRKDEIITTPFTFVATAEAIIRSGATPVFADIDPQTFNIDPRKIKESITNKTVGILPVHIFGQACFMDKICSIAKKYNLFIVEDVAQAFGASFQGKKLGTLGDCGAFSFFPSKNLGSFGDGGLVVTNNSKISGYLKALRNHGQVKKYNADYIGYNSRLDTIQAAILLAKIKYIDIFNRWRNKVAKAYEKALKKLKHIILPQNYSCNCGKRNCLSHVYNLYTIKVPSARDQLMDYLNSKGIGARIYYPVSLDKMKAFKKAKCSGGLKNLDSILPEVLSLPVHPFLTDSQINYISRQIHSFFK